MEVNTNGGDFGGSTLAASVALLHAAAQIVSSMRFASNQGAVADHVRSSNPQHQQQHQHQQQLALSSSASTASHAPDACIVLLSHTVFGVALHGLHGLAPMSE
jgi:hypothetical protein